MDIAMWRYPGPWAVYDALEAPRPDESYWAVCDADDRLVGFCCLGDCARPVGLEADPAFLDVAIGVRPELTGHGLGSEVGRVAVSYAWQVSGGRRLRCAVPGWKRLATPASPRPGTTPSKASATCCWRWPALPPEKLIQLSSIAGR